MYQMNFKWKMQINDAINTLKANLTSIGPCVAIIFPDYNKKDATFHNLFISVRRSTCFRGFSVHQELKTVHTA